MPGTATDLGLRVGGQRYEPCWFKGCSSWYTAWRCFLNSCSSLDACLVVERGPLLSDKLHKTTNNISGGKNYFR